jgi:pyruvate/2-oxoglutarate dehydrogenase complex dihydrolipoamide acyltransferase (E2) component
MENLIEAIRTALRDDAEPIARRAGLVACRKILAVLETATDDESTTAPTAVPSSEATAAPSSTATAIPPNEATAPTAAHVTPPASAPAPRIDPDAVASLVASLGKLPPEQLLDLAIARLRAALPPGTSVPAATPPLRFQIVPLHHLERLK